MTLWTRFLRIIGPLLPPKRVEFIDLDDEHAADPRVQRIAREIAEDRTGMPAYLVDDETAFAALAEAEEVVALADRWQPLVGPSSLAEAVDTARGIDPVAFINAYNAGRAPGDAAPASRATPES